MYNIPSSVKKDEFKFPYLIYLIGQLLHKRVFIKILIGWLGAFFLSFIFIWFYIAPSPF